MKRKLTLSLSVLLLTATCIFARQADSLKYSNIGFYVGAQAGLSMGESDFSSFGADGFRPGWNAGINIGYRFTDVWSLEMTATWGQLFMIEQNCCFDRNYFLGNDMNRYHPNLIPTGMDGYFYHDLKNTTFVQRYGLQANINILGFFEASKNSPWRLEVAPALYAVGTNSDIMTKKDNTPFIENINKWHLGYGGILQASYAITKNMSIGLYGGYTRLTGKQMDGMPKLHSTNHIIDAGIKFTISLAKSKKNAKPAQTHQPAPAVPAEQLKPAAPAEEAVPVTQHEETVAVTQPEEPAQTNPVEKEQTPVTEPEAPAPVVPVEEETPAAQPEVKGTEFPVIYFSFNSIWIEPSERAKVKEIADKMKADKSIRVRVTGWGDHVGGEEANKRVSLQRAEAVKRVLGQWLIPADRVETVGGGIKHDAASDSEARNATTIEIF